MQDEVLLRLFRHSVNSFDHLISRQSSYSNVGLFKQFSCHFVATRFPHFRGQGSTGYYQSPVPKMNTAVAYVIFIMALFILFGVLASFILIWKRLQGRIWKKRRRKPTSTELRRFGIPVIESTPFWVPGRIGELIDVEIQPSPHLGAPITFSTPKPRRGKIVRN